MNVCSIIGNVGRVNELRTLQNGTAVLGFSVAHTIKRKGEETTTWFDCGMFGNRAEALAPYIKVGDKIGVTGSIALKEFTDRSGATRTAIKLTVSDVTLLGGGGRSQSGQSNQHRQAAAPPPGNQPRPAQQYAAPADNYDDDIPF